MSSPQEPTFYRVTVVATTWVRVPASSPEQAEEYAVTVAGSRWPSLRWLVSMTEEEL